MIYGSFCSVGCLGSDDIVFCEIVVEGMGEGFCVREGEYGEW